MTVLTSYIRNPKAKNDLFGTTTYGGANNFKLEQKPTEGPSGSSAFKFYFYDGETGDGGVILDTYTLDPGTYALQWQSETNSLVTNSHLVVRDSGYNVLGQKHYGASRPWTADSLTFTVSARTTVQVLFGLGSYGAVSGGTCWFTRFALTKTSTVPTYFDGDTPDVAPSGSTPGNTYSWTGTPHQSTSTWDNNVTAGTTPTTPTSPTTPVTPTAPAGFTLVDFDDFTDGNTSPSAARWRVFDNGGANGSVASSGWSLWPDPNSTISTIRADYTDPAILAGIDYIVATPTGKWLGQPWVPLGSTITGNAVTAATTAGKRVVFIFYNFPDRDAGGSSSGGAANNSEYLAWITEQCVQIGDAYAVVAIEPDTLPLLLGQRQSGVINQTVYEAKLGLLSQAVDIIRLKCPNTTIYMDAGHSQWSGPSDLAPALVLAGVAKCHGINENISNFRPTSETESHANQIIDILENQYSIPKGRLGYIIDTSRNGAPNPPNPSDWQNPPGVALGTRSRYDPNGLDGNRRRHGLIWMKVPGESDGQYNAGGDGIAPPADLSPEPTAGSVYPKMVVHIIRNSTLVSTSVSGSPVTQANGLLAVLGQADYTGGVTAASNQLKYGRWETRERVERGSGYASSFALKSNSIADGEIGFLLNYDGGADKLKAYVRGPDGVEKSTTIALDLTVLHTFAIQWTATAIGFYIDGGKAWEVTDASSQPAVALSVQLGLTIGSGSPIARRTTTTPQPYHLYIDSVGTYRQDSTTTPDNGQGSGGSSNGVAVDPWYKYGAPPSMGVTQARQYARAIYDAFVLLCFTQNGMKPDMPAGAWRVSRPDQPAYNAGTFNGTVSEGLGYAMILCAIFGNPALPAGIYDPKAEGYLKGLLIYAKYYMNAHGVVDWSIDYQGNRTDTGGATDADLDIALALVLAHRIFGSSGATNYAAEATKLINAIRDYEFTPAAYGGTGGPNVMMNGDQWGVDTDAYMPDYFRAGHMRLFYEHTGDPRWLAIIAKNYPLARGYFDQVYSTGMVPDESTRASTPRGGSSYKWSYNAIRSPWGTVMEYLWYGDAGANALAKKQANKLAAFGKTSSGGNPANLKAEYNLDGTPTQTYNNIAHAQAFGVASIADTNNSDFASACLTYMYDRRLTDRTYFGTALAALSAAAISGLMQTYAGNATTPTSSTVSLSINDFGASTDSVGLRVSRLVKITDVGTSNDSVALRVTRYLAINDFGSSADSVSLSVGGATPSINLRINDVGTSNDTVRIGGGTVRIEILDYGHSDDSVALQITPGVNTRPVVGRLAELLYEGIGKAFTKEDDDHGWNLLRFCAGLTYVAEEDYELVHPLDGTPAWSRLVDADTTPDNALAWLGQFVGVSPNPGVLDAYGQRLRIKDASGFKRGTIGAITAAAKSTLTGQRNVQIYEREGSPYRLRVLVFAGEAPDPQLTYEQVKAQVPAGLKLTFAIVQGISYNELTASGKTYEELVDTYGTYNNMTSALPTEE